MAQIFMGGYPSESSVADLKRTHARTLQNRFNIRCHQLRAWQPVLTHNFTRQADITAPPHVDECSCENSLLRYEYEKEGENEREEKQKADF